MKLAENNTESGSLSDKPARGERKGYISTEAERRFRVAFVNTHPIQYFAPLYAYMQGQAGIDVTALYLSDFSIRGAIDPGFKQAVTWDLDLLAGYTPRFMGDRAGVRRPGGFFSMVAPELFSEIRNGGYDAVVIHGHNLAAHSVALAACRYAGVPALARAETHLGLRRPGWKNAIRTPLVGAWYREFSAFLAIGSGNARYFAAMGVPEKKIFSMPYTVDNARFIAASTLSPDDRARTRAGLGLTGDTPAILFAAKLDDRKRPKDLIDAFALLQREGVKAQLVIVGSGAKEGDLKAQAEALNLGGVSFPGFVNQNELPRVYGACEVFSLPSENEPWGLAVNEAMCAGLPIVLSKEIGCAEDLVADGINGGVHHARDVKGLAQALKPLLVDPAFRTRAGQASRARIEAWSYRETSLGLRAALNAVTQRKGSRPSWARGGGEPH